MSSRFNVARWVCRVLENWPGRLLAHFGGERRTASMAELEALGVKCGLHGILDLFVQTLVVATGEGAVEAHGGLGGTIASQLLSGSIDLVQ